MNVQSPISATDWIRIFASRMAMRRPHVRAEDVVALAIDHFKCSPALAPELAAERFDAAFASTSDRRRLAG